MKIACLTCLLFLALVAAPRVSSAGPESPTPAAEASAREHFQRGQRLSASGDYAAAYREFAAGYALTERPLFLFNMAEAARAGGDLARARDNYMQFLHADPKNALAATAQQRLAEMDRTAGGGASATPPKEPAPPPPAVGPPPAPPAGVTTAPAGPPRETAGPPPAVKPVPPATTTTGTASLTRGSQPPGPEGKPIWKKWPFWAAVGGVVATSALVLAVGRDPDPCGDGCSQFNFR